MSDIQLPQQRLPVCQKLGRDLLSIWEERRESGNSVSAEELCLDCPELVDEVRWQIRALEAVDSHFGPTRGDFSTPADVGATDGRDPTHQTLQITSEYKIERHHASGGLGDVFVAFDPVLNRCVAVKFPRVRRLTMEQLAHFQRDCCQRDIVAATPVVQCDWHLRDGEFQSAFGGIQYQFGHGQA